MCFLRNLRSNFAVIKKNPTKNLQKPKQCTIFAVAKTMVIIAQLVRASDCGSEGRGFEPRFSPKDRGKQNLLFSILFCVELSMILFARQARTAYAQTEKNL